VGLAFTACALSQLLAARLITAPAISMAFGFAACISVTLLTARNPATLEAAVSDACISSIPARHYSFSIPDILRVLHEISCAFKAHHTGVLRYM